MATNNKSKLKLLYIRQMLEDETDSEHGLTMHDIIDRLEQWGITSERKSIYRDLDVLREYGLDIKTYQRNPVEYAIDHRDFKLSELMLMVDAVESSRFLTQRQSNLLVNNIKMLASDNQREQLNKRIHVVGQIKSKNESVFGDIDAIHQALREGKKVSFTYFKYGPNKQRVMQHDGKPYVLTPVKVVYADGFYYLTAYSKKYDDFAHYRIDRMRAVKVLNEPADRNEKVATHRLDESEYQSFGSFGGDKVATILNVLPDKVDIILDRFGSDVQLTTAPDGTIKAHVTICKSQQFFGWIAGLGKTVTIASPASLVQEYKSYLQSLIED